MTPHLYAKDRSVRFACLPKLALVLAMLFADAPDTTL